MTGGPPTQPKRNDRLIAACEAAVDRLESREAVGVDPDIFAELGEVLFWLGALAEAKGQQGDRLLLGLRWARNRITHGVLVTAPTSWHYGAEPGRLVLGRAVLGTSSGHEFLPRDRVVLGPNDKPSPGQATAYDSEVAGRRVLELVRRALQILR
jgi:hypothetical protein